MNFWLFLKVEKYLIKCEKNSEIWNYKKVQPTKKISATTISAKKFSPGGMGGWRGVKASLRIAYSNQKINN